MERTAEQWALVAEAVVIKDDGVQCEDDLATFIRVQEQRLADAEALLVRLARIPTNMRDVGENWTARMATHGAEARDAAKDYLAERGK